jgi:hypothetical protein
MAVFEVTDKTILKILVRRGLESERQEVRFDEGELGYTIDTKRLFVGDGLGGGGNVVGNIYQGTVSDAFTVLSVVPGIQYGDLIYDTSESTLYVVNDEESSELFDIGPRYEENVLEKTSSDVGYVRIAEACLGKFNDGLLDKRKAFFLDYSIPEPFYQTSKVIEMNTQYWAITSASNFNPSIADGVFYFGDIKAISTLNPVVLSSRINIDVSNPNDRISKALTIWGVGGRQISFGSSGEIGNAAGQTDIIGLSGIAFHPNVEAINPSNPNISTKVFFAADGTATFSQGGGNIVSPAFSVNGFSRFADSMQINGDLVVQGNLSAFGDFSVFETYLTVNSALSVINFTDKPALFIQQYNNSNDVIIAHPQGNQRIFLMDEDGDFMAGYSAFVGGKASGTVSTSPNITPGNTNIVTSNFYIRDGYDGTITQPSEFDVSIRRKISLMGGNLAAPGTNYTLIDNSDGILFSQGFTNFSNAVASFIPSTDISTSVVAINADASTGGFHSGLKIRGTTTAGSSTSLLYVAERNNTGGTGANGRYFFIGTATSGGTDVEKFSVRTNGDVYMDGNLYAEQDIVAFYSSDITVKENVQVISNPLEKIERIKGVTFNWNKEYQEKLKQVNDVGIIAQDVEQVIPEATTTRKSGIKAVNYDKIIPLLIESVKELNKKIDQLAANK